MPYNPSTGVYTLPAIYLAIPGTTIIAAQHNTPLVDLQTANNYPRPIVAGGTDADNAEDARTELAVPGLADTNVFTARNSWAKGADLVSALAMTIGEDGNYFHVTGSSAITSFSTVAAGTVIMLEFTANATLTYNAGSMILPNGGDITTAAGDVAIFVSEGSGNWRCINYMNGPSGVGGVWSPTLTAVLNVSAVSSGSMYFTVQGLNVHCFGAISITPTASPAVTSIRISIPVSSNFTTIFQAAGVGVNTNLEAANLVAVVATNDILLTYQTLDGAQRVMSVNFSYRIA